MMSDRIAVMHQGRMWQVGSPREVYEHPRNLFVSRFLGVSNELPGRVGEAVGDAYLFQPDDERVPVFPVRTAAGESRGRSVTWSIRPERLRMSRERPAGPDPVLTGVIEKVFFAGSETKYLVRVGRATLWETRTTGAMPQPCAAGDPVYLHWSLADGRVFVE